MEWKKDIEVITPLFNRGAYQESPEVRVPSIRGMVRGWFRALGGPPAEEKQVFGGMKSFAGTNMVNASQLVFRVTNVNAKTATPQVPTLPHKSSSEASPKAAFVPGATFSLQVFTRFGDLDARLESKVINALEVWLLLGALGLRANRSGGNVWPRGAGAPATSADLRASLTKFGCRWPVRLAGLDVGSTLDELRKAATDTVAGTPAVFGCIKPYRMGSPLKFKIIRLDNQLRLIAYAADDQVLNQAQGLLKGHRCKPETWTAI